uniref:Uncharacterized protein n=1 Tax=Triticum urartu TaxID=4572 RepID=A0A8R7PQE6_TRIUA
MRHSSRSIRLHHSSMIRQYVMKSVQHCIATGVFVNCSWVMVKVLCQMLKGAVLRPHWAKACCHLGAAHMLLKEYEQACNAFLDA